MPLSNIAHSLLPAVRHRVNDWLARREDDESDDQFQSPHACDRDTQQRRPRQLSTEHTHKVIPTSQRTPTNDAASRAAPRSRHASERDDAVEIEVVFPQRACAKRSHEDTDDYPGLGHGDKVSRSRTRHHTVSALSLHESGLAPLHHSELHGDADGHCDAAAQPSADSTTVLSSQPGAQPIVAPTPSMPLVYPMASGPGSAPTLMYAPYPQPGYPMYHPGPAQMVPAGSYPMPGLPVSFSSSLPHYPHSGPGMQPPLPLMNTPGLPPSAQYRMVSYPHPKAFVAESAQPYHYTTLAGMKSYGPPPHLAPPAGTQRGNPQTALHPHTQAPAAEPAHVVHPSYGHNAPPPPQWLAHPYPSHGPATTASIPMYAYPYAMSAASNMHAVPSSHMQAVPHPAAGVTLAQSMPPAYMAIASPHVPTGAM
jgi:hypothetical protein